MVLIEVACLRRWTAPLGQGAYLHDAHSRIERQRQDVANADFGVRLVCGLPVDPDQPAFDHLDTVRPAGGETGAPEPFVEPLVAGSWRGEIVVLRHRDE